MNRLFAGVSVVATLAVLAGCTNSTTSPSEPSSDEAAVVENDPSSRQGSDIVYQRIESSTNCVGLQREFDVAMENAETREPGDDLRDVSLSYASAAHTRMQEVGCYG